MEKSYSLTDFIVKYQRENRVVFTKEDIGNIYYISSELGIPFVILESLMDMSRIHRKLDLKYAREMAELFKLEYFDEYEKRGTLSEKLRNEEWVEEMAEQMERYIIVFTDFCSEIDEIFCENDTISRYSLVISWLRSFTRELIMFACNKTMKLGAQLPYQFTDSMLRKWGAVGIKDIDALKIYEEMQQEELERRRKAERRNREMQ